MKQKNQKGFTLVLSLILLVVMSLMGGALIVIASGDHQSNNNSDNYQQTFYVAETALLEGEKYIINKYLGKWNTTSLGAAVRNRTTRTLPSDKNDVDISTDCYRSYPTTNLIEDDKVVFQYRFTFGHIFQNVFPEGSMTDDQKKYIFPNIDTVANRERIDAELAYLNQFYYEFIVDKIGPAPFWGFGTSIKKGAQDSSINGIAYRVYGCGIYMGYPQIIVPLESVLVLPAMG